MRALPGILTRHPVGHVLNHGRLVRNSDAAQHHISYPPRLGVEHVEGEPLVLHAQKEQLGVMHPGHALIQIGRRQPVARLQPQVVRQEGEVVLIAGAQDDRIDLLRRAVLEIGRVFIDMGQQRHLLPVRGPVKPHRRRAVRHRQRPGAVFPALRPDILGRIGGADQQDILVLELHRVAEIMGMQDAAIVIRKTLEFRHVRGREMARGDDDMVEILGIHPVGHKVMRGDGELAAALVILNKAHRRAKPDPIPHPGLVDPPLDIVEQHGARRIAGDLLAEMFLE